MVEQMTNLERIANTPIPKSCKRRSKASQSKFSDSDLFASADSIHLKQCVSLYLFALPFTLIKELGWAMIPVVTVVAFTFMGIEGIADEIEMPFGERRTSSAMEYVSHACHFFHAGLDDADLPLGFCFRMMQGTGLLNFHHRSLLL